MRLLSYFFIILITTSCGSIRIIQNNDFVVSKDDYITIYPLKDGDKTGTLNELKYMLISKGYRYVSYDAIDRSDKYKGKKIYAIDLSFTYYYDMIWWYSNFSLEIEDIYSRDVMISAVFRGEKPCYFVLKSFVKKFDTLVE